MMAKHHLLHIWLLRKKNRHDVYIGRPGKWGNPFKIGPDGTREDVIRKYYIWLTSSGRGRQILEEAMIELPGKVLGCHCSPEACHGHVLAGLVNGQTVGYPNLSNYTVLEDGLVLIKNAFSVEVQQEMINEIIPYATGKVEGVGSFFAKETIVTTQAGYVDPVPENSDPTSSLLNLGTKARMNIPFDKSPLKIWNYCKALLDNACLLSPSIPAVMNPTVFRLNYYTLKGKIGWHYDRHPGLPLDQQHTVKSPVVSVTLGNAGTFDYEDRSAAYNLVVGENQKELKFKSVKLSSGDVIIFGGPSRQITHRMLKIWPHTRPTNLEIPKFNGVDLANGRFNFAFYEN